MKLNPVKRLSFRLQCFSYFNLRPKFVATRKWIQTILNNIRSFFSLPEKDHQSDSLTPIDHFMLIDRTVLRAVITLIISAFSMLTAGMLLSYPGGIIRLTAEFLVLANQSLGGQVPIEQLLAALGAAIIFLIDFSVLLFYMIDEPIWPRDISDQLVEFDAVLEQRFEIVHNTLDNEIIPLLKNDDEEDIRVRLKDDHDE